ncbi:MAG: DUF1043 family protein [Perlucidibaca sp.]
MTVLLYLLVFLLGAAAGALYAKKQPSDHRVTELEELLHDLQGRHERYQRDVSEHFEQTAHLVNELTQRYRDVHEHLVQGALALCDDPKRHRDENPARVFHSLEGPAGSPASAPVYAPYSRLEDHELIGFEPPRDYATKSPTDKGTLDERFGFK